MDMAERIRRKIEAGLAPEMLEIVDDSESHRGHGGWREGGETHFNMRVVADAFNGKTRVARQRMVFDLLSEEMAGPVHALSLICETPQEAGLA